MYDKVDSLSTLCREYIRQYIHTVVVADKQMSNERTDQKAVVLP